MAKKQITGGVRMEQLLKRGLVNAPYLWIDCYNQRVDTICGTTTTRINNSGHYYVSVCFREKEK